MGLGGTRWLLHSNALTERGDSVNLMEVAGALRSLGVDEISVTYLRDHPWNSRERIEEMARLDLRMIPYREGAHARTIASAGATHLFAFGSGALTENNYSRRYPHRYRFGDYVHLMHAAFRNFEPFGDVYGYVSDWLLEWATSHRDRMSPAARTWLRLRRPPVDPSMPIVSIPHAVTVEDGDRDHFRRRHGIPRDAAVIGRIGGWDQFNDHEARRAVEALLESQGDVWFVAVNTKPKVEHDRAIYVSYLDRRSVHDFYAGIDVLINGRRMGESFGLNVVEALLHDRPVLAPAACRNPKMDLHHTWLLRDRPEWLYCTADDVMAAFDDLRSRGFHADARAMVGDRFSRAALAARLEAVTPT